MNGNGNGHRQAGAQTGVAPRVRADALPEFTRYRDQGCDFHPSCLTCPLPRCRYDEPGGVAATRRADRDEQILRLRLKRRTPIAELAALFGVSKRSVHRILRRGGL